jgi:uncharacterized protein YjbI with pentapeptide repeats
MTFNRLAKILGVDLNYFSEDFPSTAAATEKGPKAPELPAGKKNKLHWDMSRGNWVDADFSGLKDLHEKFSSSNLKGCKFIGSDLSGLLLSGNNVQKCDFSDSWINKSRIKGSNLDSNEFTHCSLQETEFSGSHIYQCDFTDADLTGARIDSGGFEKNTLTNAVWNRTSFVKTYLADLVFNGAVADCYFENCAFKRITFQNATLTNTFFKNRSLKNIRFVDCKADRMTYEFLKNGKADLSGITVIPG